MIEHSVTSDDLENELFSRFLRDGCKYDFSLFFKRGEKNIEAVDLKGDSLIFYAVLCEKKEWVESLIRHGADINLRNKDGNTALHYAVKLGIESIVITLLDAGIDANLQDKDGYTALMYAVECKNYKILTLFLNQKVINLELENNQQQTALDLAVDIQDTESVSLLSNNENLNRVDPVYKHTYLMRVIESENIPLIQFFCKYNQNINTKNIYGLTALMIAVQKGMIEAIKHIFEYHADVGIDLQDKDGYTALMYAVECKNYKILTLLLNQKVIRFELENNQQQTALDLAVDIQDTESVSLLSNNANLNRVDPVYKDTYLMRVIESENIPLVQFFCKYNQNINTKNIYRLTALMIAVQKGMIEAIKHIFEYNADVDINLQDGNGYTALMYAIDYKKNDIVFYLLQQEGINIEVMNNKKQTALTLAVKYENELVINALLDKHANVNHVAQCGCSLLITSLRFKKNISMSRLLLESDSIDVNIQDERQSVALIYAIKMMCNNTKAIEVIEKICDVSNVDINLKDKHGLSAIMFAMRFQLEDVVCMLLKHKKIDLTLTDSYNQSLLILAIKSKSINIFNWVLKTNPKLNSYDKQGFSALTLAINLLQISMIKTLVEIGVNSQCQDNRKIYPLVLASQRASVQVVKFLLRHRKTLMSDGEDIQAAFNICVESKHYDIALLILKEISFEKELPMLHLAAARGNVALVKMLLRQGKNINELDTNKMTSLHIAACYNNKEVVKVCLANHANVEALDTDGLTALMIARRENFVDCIDLLEKKSSS